MRILFDFQAFSNQKYGGVSRYFYELLNEFSNMADIDTEVVLTFSNNHYISDRKLVKHRSFFPSSDFKGKNRIQSLLNMPSANKKLKQKKFDIFHPTYYDPYFLKQIGNKPFVLTVHDMIHEKFRSRFPANDPTANNKKILVKKATKIIVVSESTKSDLIDILGIDEDKISVVYHGNSMNVVANNGQARFDLPSRYILFVGDRIRHKNFDRFIEAVAPILHGDETLNLVCVGGGKLKPGEIGIFDKLGINKKIKQYNLDDSSLAEFYRRALLFVFPSLYEGFGIPVLESFACDCPLVCSQTSSLPEIAGDGALYFNPYRLESIYEVVRNVLYNDELKKELALNGSKRLNFFSWHKSAEETKKIYQSML